MSTLYVSLIAKSKGLAHRNHNITLTLGNLGQVFTTAAKGRVQLKILVVLTTKACPPPTMGCHPMLTENANFVTNALIGDLLIVNMRP